MIDNLVTSLEHPQNYKKSCEWSTKNAKKNLRCIVLTEDEGDEGDEEELFCCLPPPLIKIMILFFV